MTSINIFQNKVGRTFIYGVVLLFFSVLLTILPALSSHADAFSDLPGGTFVSNMNNSTSGGGGGGMGSGSGGGGGGGSYKPPTNLHSSTYLTGSGMMELLAQSGRLTCGSGPNPDFPDAIGAIGASYYVFADNGDPAPASQIKHDSVHYWIEGNSRAIKVVWKYSCVFVQAGADVPFQWDGNLSGQLSCKDSPYAVWFSASYSKSSNKSEIRGGGYGIGVVNQRGPNLPEAQYNKWDLHNINCNTASQYSVNADANLSGQPYGYYRIDRHYKLKTIDVQIYTYDTRYTNGAIKINEHKSTVNPYSVDRTDHFWGSYTCANGNNPVRTFGVNDYGSLQANITTDPKDCQQNNWQCKIERGTTGLNNTNPSIAQGTDLVNSNGVMRDGSQVSFNQPSVNFYTYAGTVENTGDDAKRYIIDVADTSTPFNRALDKNNAKQYFKLLKKNSNGSYSQTDFGKTRSYPNRDQGDYKLQFFWASDPGSVWQSTFRAWIPSNTAHFKVPVVSDSSGSNNHTEMWANLGQIDCLQYGDPTPGGDPNKKTSVVLSNKTEVLRSINSDDQN